MKIVKNFLYIMVCFCFLVLTVNISVYVNADDDYENILSSANTYDYKSDYTANESHYDMSRKNSNYVDDDTLLTIITPGLGGTASHFAPFIDDNDDKVKVSNKNNIINELGEILDNKVIIKYGKVSNNNSVRIEDVTEFFIDDYEYDSSYHTILLFETKKSSYSNEYVYSQFDKTVSQVVNEIKGNNDGLLPKVNLIGHSRGGLINLLYAMDHPDMVNKIFSMGTPYVGSSTAKIDVELNDCGIGSGEKATDKEKAGEKDIVNEELYKSYKERWNSNYSLYKHIDVYAMGGSMTYGFLEKLLISKKMEDYRKIFGVSKGEFNSLRFIAADQLFRIEMQSVQYSIFHKNGWDNLTKSIIGVLGINNNDDLKLMTALLVTIENESKYKGIKKRLVWMNDGLVDLKSQLGEGYRGFKNYKKIFSPYNCNMGKCADPKQLPVVHNLEVKDKAFINYICRNIEMNERSENDPNYIKQIIKPTYLTYKLDDDSVGISSYLGSDTNVVIPNEIDGKIVKEIGYGAFQSNDDVINITIPSNVEIIKDYAFSDCTKLEDINVVGNIKDLAYSTAFGGCESLININVVESMNYKSDGGILYNKDMTALCLYPEGKKATSFIVPLSVTEIASYAFLNSNLESIYLNNTINVEGNAFKGCCSLTEIIGDNISSVGNNAFSETRYYNGFVESGNGLLAIGSVLIKYTSQNSENLISYADLSGIESISGNAFSGLEQLTIYIPSSVKIINDNAFSGIESLNIYVSSPYNNIKTTFNDDIDLKFSCARELKDYYSKIIDEDISVFDGIDVDKAFVIKKFFEYRNDEDLYVGDQPYKLYEGEYITISDINWKDPKTKYYTYYLEGLYYDKDCQIRYELDEIGYDECNEYWAKWAGYKYKIIYDFNGGNSYYYNLPEEIVEYNYYTEIGLLSGNKAHCHDILYWETDTGYRYYIDGDYSMANFISSGLDKDDMTIKLTAVWEYITYQITYYYNGFNGRYDSYQGYYNYYEYKTLDRPLANGYILIGWYNRADVDENECDYSYEYINGFKERYYGEIELYCKWYRNGTYIITDEYKITDSGRFNQKYDTINLFEVTRIGVGELIELGYTTIKVTMVITLKEIDNGTQYIFIFERADENNDYLLETFEINDAGSKYSDRTFEFTLNLYDLDSDMLFIRFGASGSFNDDWKTSSRQYSIKVVC